jgi:4-phosphopantoate---beta-alanine ligase
MDVPKSHPRYLSLITRDKIVQGVERGVTSVHGLIAHGRGEAFDYLLGEKTHPFAKRAIRAACEMLRAAEHPVLSVNGNVCALAAPEMVRLAKACGAKLEINIFHTSEARELAMRQALLEAGAQEVLMPSRTHALEHIDHNRRWVNPEGIFRADVVFVPLEDGDRCGALIKNGKRVITIDLNPCSRTARTASVTIVDNLMRALPAMCHILENPDESSSLGPGYENAAELEFAEAAIRSGNPGV